MKKRISLTKIILLSYCLLILVSLAVLLIIHSNKAKDPESAEPTASTVVTEAPRRHYIEEVPVIVQSDLMAGCETYACTMLLQFLGYDVNEYIFADNYLIKSPFIYDDNGNRYGPDMYSAFAGDVYGYGCGIFAPAMAKSMNNYFKECQSDDKAFSLNEKSLEALCDEYIDNDIPVMIWATVNMQEPYKEESWIVSYVDENSRSEKGDTVWWMKNEHCLVLIGYDENDYYFADSCAGEVSHFEKDICQLRFDELGNQSIVVKQR